MRASKTDAANVGASKKLSHPEWTELLSEAVSKPGIISQAYSRFWNYSVGNQILALFQCLQRRIELGPIHTFRGWHEVGRHVRRGEKAITLCMPVRVKRKVTKEEVGRTGDGAERLVTGAGGTTADPDGAVSVTIFAYKPHWFVLSQTDGEPYVPQELPDWSEGRTLHSLAIDRVPFAHPDGNCQGYARNRQVAVSPIAVLPHKTLFHELAHVVLGHTEESQTLDDHDLTPRSLREVEAECVALICCESLKLAGADECRGYIQHWFGTQTIPDRNAQRIFKAANSLLKAGYPEAQRPSQDSSGS